jgi:hypothetical protein
MPTRAPFWAGSWYFLVTVVSAGLLAWIPFVHAAHRLHRRSTAVWAVVYGAASALLVTLLSLTPAEPQSGTAGDTFAFLAGTLLPCIIIAGCVQQAFLRRAVYFPQPKAAPELALASALAARARRTEARRIATQDPLLARDLHIGRPDLPRSYDDGGLVDLNTAPALAIAKACDLTPDLAGRIVTARDGCGGFMSVDDVFSLVDLPITTWDFIRDRGLVVPAAS